jgi:hypothetical protein
MVQRPVSVLIPTGSSSHMHMCAHSYLLSSLFGGVEAGCGYHHTAGRAVAATLDTRWDLPMDCLSCGRGCTWGGEAHIGPYPLQIHPLG